MTRSLASSSGPPPTVTRSAWPSGRDRQPEAVGSAECLNGGQPGVSGGRPATVVDEKSPDALTHLTGGDEIRSAYARLVLEQASFGQPALGRRRIGQQVGAGTALPRVDEGLDQQERKRSGFYLGPGNPGGQVHGKSLAAFRDYQDPLTGLVVTSKLNLVVRTHVIGEYVVREYVVQRDADVRRPGGER